MAETQSLNIPGETNTAHGVQWSLKLHHLRMWPATLLKHLTKCYTWLLFNLSRPQEISWAPSSIYISYSGSSRNLKILTASGLNSSCHILLTSICEQQTKISWLCDHSSLIIRYLPKSASDFNNCIGQSVHSLFISKCVLHFETYKIFEYKKFSFANMVGSFSENRATTVQKGFTVWK